MKAFPKEMIKLISTKELTYKNLSNCSKYPLLENKFSDSLLRLQQNNINDINNVDFSKIPNNTNNLFLLEKGKENKNLNIVRYNNTSKLNIMNTDLLKDLYTTMDIITNNSKNSNNNKEISLLLLGDTTNKTFYAGADLKHIYSQNQLDSNFMYLFTYYYYYVMEELRKLSNNTISIWNGITMGGGIGVSIYSKFKIATETTLLAMPESKFGFFTNATYNHFIKDYLSSPEALHFNYISRTIASWEVYNSNFADYFILNKYVNSIIDFMQSHDVVRDEKTIKKFFEYLMAISIEEIGMIFNEDKNKIEYKSDDKRGRSNISRIMSSLSNEYLNVDSSINSISNNSNERNNAFNNNSNVSKEFTSIYNRIISDETEKEINSLKKHVNDNYIRVKYNSMFNKNSGDNDINNIDDNSLSESDIFIFNKYIYLSHLKNSMLMRSKYCLKLNYEITKMSYLNLDYETNFDYDMKAIYSCIENGDMFEGIRSYFVDKDSKPQWNKDVDFNKNIIYDF